MIVPALEIVTSILISSVKDEAILEVCHILQSFLFSNSTIYRALIRNYHLNNKESGHLSLYSGLLISAIFSNISFNYLFIYIYYIVLALDFHVFDTQWIIYGPKEVLHF